MKDDFKPKANKEKESISFVNDAEVKRAIEKLKKKKITANVVFGKTLKFVNTAEFKKAKSIIGINEMKKSELRQIIKEEIKSLLNEGTPASIGFIAPSGAVYSIYVNNDGGLKWVGKYLKKYYSTPKKIEQLIGLGNASSLEPKLLPKGEHSYRNPEKDVTVFYGRDRGEKGQGPRKSRDVEQYVNDAEGNYIYLYDPKQKEWTHTDGSVGGFKKF